ncbi:MAG: ComEC/Rec2 family competence protein [Candidatus Paceibacterota bacterium]
MTDLLVKLKKNLRLYFLAIFFVGSCFIWYAVLREGDAKTLQVDFLNVGQGDAIYIEAPNGNQLLIDGGPGKILLTRLGEVMPFYDRSIDMLLITNSDSDHMAGFIDLMNSYGVEKIIEQGTNPNTAIYKEVEQLEKEKGIEKVVARRGMKIILDEEDGVYLDILFPDRDVSGSKTNDASIVAHLIYGKNSYLLTGDSPQNVEKYLISLDGGNLKSDVLKVGHHGSRTSTSDELLGYISPKYAVISAGLNNSYGHPHKETIDVLNKFNIKTFITFKDGTIVTKSDGETINFEFLN